jgi:hypothetical protein
MIKNARMNSLYSKNILNYCKISTQESIRNLIEKIKIKNKYINITKIVNIENETNPNPLPHDIIINIYMILSISSLLFYLNKMIK